MKKCSGCVRFEERWGEEKKEHIIVADNHTQLINFQKM